MWYSDSGGAHLPSGCFLHCEVLSTQNPVWGKLHIIYLCLFNSEMYFYLSPVPDYVKATVETVMKIHETEDDGDVLAFLTGQVSGQPFLNNLHLTDLKDKDCISWFHLSFNYYNAVWAVFFSCLFIIFSSIFPPRKRWRRWCHFCRTKQGLCHDMAWKNTWEFCPCTLGYLMLTKWKSLRGHLLLFAR